MKKFFSLLAAFIIINTSIAIVPFDGAKPIKATEIMLPIGNSGKTISLAAFSKLQPAEYEKLAQVKLGFFDRLAYRMAMKKLRKSIAKDGTITNKKVISLFEKKQGDSSGAQGFVLGFVFLLIGVLIAYLIKDDKRSKRIKWAWIGFASIAVLFSALLIALVIALRE